MSWIVGNASGSQTLTDNDDLYAEHINELRAAADRLKVFDVRDYGAVGNGSTDDQPAIQAAVNAAAAVRGRVRCHPDDTYALFHTVSFAGKSNVYFDAGYAHFVIPQAQLHNFGFGFMFVGNSSSFDCTFDSLYLDGGFSGYTAPPSSQGGGIVPATRWKLIDCVFKDFNYFGLFTGLESIDVKIVRPHFIGPGSGVDHYGGGGGRNVQMVGAIWDSNIVGNAIDQTGGTDYDVRGSYNYSDKNFYFEGLVGISAQDNHLPGGGGISILSDGGYAPATITNSRHVKVVGNKLLGGGAITYTLSTHPTTPVTVGGDVFIHGNDVDTPDTYGILVQAGSDDVTKWGHGYIVTDNDVTDANDSNLATQNTGLAIINPSGINIAQGLDVVVAGNTCVDGRGTPRQRYGVEIGQTFGPAATNEPNRVSVVGNRVSGVVTAKIKRVSSTYTTDYTELSNDLALAGDVLISSGHVGVNATTSLSRPVTIQGADSTNDMLQFRNNSGVDKWHFAVTGGTDVELVETDVAQNRIRIKPGGHIGFGASPSTSAAFEVASTDGALLIPRLTTTQKNALTPVNGMLVYDSTLNKFQGYENSGWVSLI